RIHPDGTNYATLHSFSRTQGTPPMDGVIQASDGKLYGVTPLGGTNNKGIIYRMALDGTGFTVLYNFNTTDGANPNGGLLQASDGNLYGTTGSGGAHNAGTVFQLTLSGTLTTLCSFNNIDGAGPTAT